MQIDTETKAIQIRDVTGEVRLVDPDELRKTLASLVGVKWVAESLEISPATVQNRKNRGELPVPVVPAGLRGPLWMPGQFDELLPY